MIFSRAVHRRGLAVFAALVAVASIGVLARAQTVTRAASEPFQRSAATRVIIPDTFEIPVADSGLHLTSIVTTDLDSDGDLDVVASDGATHLFVWINDGAGHLTRKTPRPLSDQQPATSTPSVAERPATALVSIQPSGSVVLPSDLRVWIDFEGRAFRPRGRPASSSQLPGSLGSRAPPASPFLS